MERAGVESLEHRATGSSGPWAGSPQLPRRSPYPPGLRGRLGDPEAKVALDPTPRGASLIFAEFLEVHAVAYVVGAPPMEEAIWLVGATSAVSALGGCRAFALALSYLALGT